MHHNTARALRTFLLCLLVGAVCACVAAQRTAIDEHSTDSNADIAHMKTYRWDFSAMGKLAPDGSHLAEFDRVLCEHVDKELAAKGYQRVDKGPADFSMDYRVVVTAQEAVESAAAVSENEQGANEYGLRWTFDKDESPSFKGLQAPKDQTMLYQHGVLHLAAFDQQGQSLWHTSASRVLNGRNNEAERRAALRIVLEKLMKKMPASAAGTK